MIKCCIQACKKQKNGEKFEEEILYNKLSLKDHKLLIY